MSTKSSVRNDSNATKWFIAASSFLVIILIMASAAASYGEPAQFAAALIGT